MNKKFFKKGAALEMTIVMMITLFAFCTLIFAASFRESIRDSYTNTNIKVVQNIEELGDSFYSQIASNYNDSTDGNELIKLISLKDVFILNDKLNKNIVYKEGNVTDDFILEVTRNINEEDILYLKVIVSVNKNTKNIKISEWYFNNPINDNSYIEELEKEYLK